MTRTWTVSSLSLSLGAALVAGGLAACQPATEDDAESFRNSTPREETVAMTVPQASSGQKLTAVTVETHESALRGDVSGFYKLTRDVSGVVNGAGVVVLAIMKAVVLHRPTTLTADSAVWGPWNGGPLDPLTYRVTVKKAGGTSYDYLLEAHAKADANAAFVVLLTGTHTPTLGTNGRPLEGFGKGTFTLDWDARATLPAPDDNVGKVTYVYSRESAAAVLSVTAQFRHVKDDDRPGQVVDVDYVFSATPGAGGSMEFVRNVPAAMNTQGNRWAVKSRWAESGAGRTDVAATGGALPAGGATASECWNTSFASVFLSASWAPAAGWGDENADCAFKPAEYSKL